MGLFLVLLGKVDEQARAENLKAVEDALDVVEKILEDEYFGGS